MNDYSNFNGYYNELLTLDLYPQLSDEWHTKEMKAVIDNWIAPLGIHTVLDVGAGEGDAQKLFEAINVAYVGVAVGRDVQVAQQAGRDVLNVDYNFLGDMSIDLVFARHSLEHSPFPIITLMEWHRVSNHWICIIMPNPEHFTYVGRNHYSVATPSQIVWWLRRAGWRPKRMNFSDKEFKFLCEKKPRLSHEGYVPKLTQALHEFERDELKIGVGDIIMPDGIEFMERRSV